MLADRAADGRHIVQRGMKNAKRIRFAKRSALADHLKMIDVPERLCNR